MSVGVGVHVRVCVCTHSACIYESVRVCVCARGAVHVLTTLRSSPWLATKHHALMNVDVVLKRPRTSVEGNVAAAIYDKMEKPVHYKYNI